MIELGYASGVDWQTRKFEGAGHSEIYWNQRIQIPLKFLLGTEPGLSNQETTQDGEQ